MLKAVPECIKIVTREGALSYMTPAGLSLMQAESLAELQVKPWVEWMDAKDRPAFPLLQNALYFGGLSRTLSSTTRGALDQAISPQDWNTLFLSSPEFMVRQRAEAPHEPS